MNRIGIMRGSVSRIGIVLLMLLSAVLTVFAGGDMAEMFTYEHDNFAGCDINYRKAELNGGCDRAKVVVLFLHGGSGQGSDNKAQMNNPAVSDVYNYLKERGYNAIILVPQAPYGQQWMGSILPALKELTDKYAADGGREIYVMGGSMGGNGTWNMLMAYPGYFAGAMPVACNTPKGKYENFTGTRIYSVVGGNDRKRKIGDIRSFFRKIEEKGGTVNLDVENSWGHRQTCEWSFTPERLDRLFGADSIK